VCADVDAVRAQAVDLPAESAPDALREVVGDVRLVPVWDNSAGGRTFRIPMGGGIGHAYLKWAPAGTPLDLVGEIARTTWAQRWIRVPELLDHGTDADGGRWMLSSGILGESAVAPRWTDDPEHAVPAIAIGLRAMHDTLPVDECPFEWSVEHRIAAAGVSDAEIAALGPAPAHDRIVVCHGDPCSPNTLIGADGQWVGHVDLDQLGIADRWADLAVATMSLGWNYGPGWDDVFYAAYGIEPDQQRIDWYRALWNLGDEHPPSHRVV
jgi:kanamycin kinase